MRARPGDVKLSNIIQIENITDLLTQPLELKITLYPSASGKLILILTPNGKQFIHFSLDSIFTYKVVAVLKPMFQVYHITPS